jgi:hypothetical protein
MPKYIYGKMLVNNEHYEHFKIFEFRGSLKYCTEHEEGLFATTVYGLNVCS